MNLVKTIIKPKSKIFLNMNMGKEKIGDKIGNLSSELKSFANMEDAILILNNFKNKNKDVNYNQINGTYRYLNYYIIPGVKPQDSSFIRNIKFINNLGHCKTSAPELVHYGLSKDNKFNVIIYKLNDTKGGDLIPVVSLKDVLPEKKANFLKEQLNLLDDTGLYNNDAIDSYKYWFLTPDTGNIFIDSWGRLKKCTSAVEKNNLKEILKNLI